MITMVAMAMLLELRLYVLMNGSAYAAAAAQQGRYTVAVAHNRPNFLDCEGHLLTGTTTKELALIRPWDSTSGRVLAYTDESYEEEFWQRMEGGLPFVTETRIPIPASEPIETISVRRRYSDENLARHLLGYLDYDGHGVSGLEYALNSYLNANTTRTMMSVAVNARGYTTPNSEIIFREDRVISADVMLTINRDIQAVAEEIAQDSLERGAIVMLDAETFGCAAMVSTPNYSQNNVAASLGNNKGELINRALGAFNAGSIYKPVVAAAALEAGVQPDYSYYCTGEIEVNGHSYTCYNSISHGYVDMHGALTVSCNGYFISLGQHIGSEAIYNMAADMGVGRPLELYPGYATTAGSMPTVAELETYGELCNHCFGQGKLLVSPAQVAAYTACIANGGVMKNVSVVYSLGGEVVMSTSEKRVMSAETAALLAAGMKSVVENGTGVQGKPTYTDAAGKTGTAQTGRYNADGTEMVNGWFTGWFPADNPKYIVTIMTENAGSSSASAAPVFRQLVNSLYVRGIVA